MNESRNRFFFPAVVVLATIALIKALSRGRLAEFLLEQGLLLLAVGVVVGAIFWTESHLRKRHTEEWMTRYHRWLGRAVIAVCVLGIAPALILINLRTGGGGELVQTALPLLFAALFLGTIVGLDGYFRKRRSDQWMNGYRICVALTIVVLITGLCAYLLSKNPQ